jgi:hypothetical protein
MASVLPFNNIKIGGVQVAGPDEFSYGTGRVTKRGEDNALSTADGLIHNFRTAVQYEGSCELKGSFLEKETASPASLDGQGWPQLAAQVELGYVSARGGEAAAVAAFPAIIAVEYDSENDKSTVTFAG